MKMCFKKNQGFVKKCNKNSLWVPMERLTTLHIYTVFATFCDFWLFVNCVVQTPRSLIQPIINLTFSAYPVKIINIAPYRQGYKSYLGKFQRCLIFIRVYSPCLCNTGDSYIETSIVTCFHYADYEGNKNTFPWSWSICCRAYRQS